LAALSAINEGQIALYLHNLTGLLAFRTTLALTFIGMNLATIR